MKLSAFTTTVLFTLIACAVAVVYAPSGHTSSICKEAAHEIQESRQRGELTRKQAEHLIKSCLRWEARQRLWR